MSGRFLSLALALIATTSACTSDPGATGAESTPTPTVSGPAIFVAQRAKADGPPRAGLFSGRYAVRNGCLVLEADGGPTYLAVWPAGSRVESSAVQVKVDGASLALGTQVTVGGGIIAKDASVIKTAPPSACAFDWLAIGG